MLRGFCTSSSSNVGTAAALIRENAWQCGQFRAVSRSSPKCMWPIESMKTFMARGSSTRERFVLDAMRLRGFFAFTPLEIFHVVLEISFEPHHLGVAFEGEDVGRDAIEEPAIVR